MQMKTPQFGYAILYTGEPKQTMEFYEKAFRLSRRFFQEEMGYGELETGATTLVVSNVAIEKSNRMDAKASTTDEPAFGFHISLVTEDVSDLYQNALAHGAVDVKAPALRPWGQTEASVRDNNGILVNLVSSRQS
jgi:lactoylglutathione lyase